MQFIEAAIFGVFARFEPRMTPPAGKVAYCAVRIARQRATQPRNNATEPRRNAVLCHLIFSLNFHVQNSLKNNSNHSLLKFTNSLLQKLVKRKKYWAWFQNFCKFKDDIHNSLCKLLELKELRIIRTLIIPKVSWSNV